MDAPKGTAPKNAPAAKAKPKAAPAKPAAKSEAPKASAKAAPRKKGPIGDLDPMSAAAAESKKTKIIQCARKPKQGWMYRVICPMCECNNFLPEAAAGREVKCCNTDCMVPVFTAPKPEVEEAPEPEKPKGLPGWVLGLVSVVVLGALGAATYIFVLAPPPKPSGPIEYETTTFTPTNDTPVIKQDVNPLDNIAETGMSGQFDGLTIEDVKQKALKQIENASRSQSSSRARNYGTLIHALASLKLNDTETFEAKCNTLEQSSGSLKFMAIYPLAEAAVLKIQQGENDPAKALVSRAMALQGSIPNNGRDAAMTRMSLATASILTGNGEQAWEVLKKKPDATTDGEIAARLMLSEALKTTDINQTFQVFPVLSFTNPQVSVAAFRAAQLGDAADVLLWAIAEDDPQLQTDALIGWSIGQLFSASASAPTVDQLVQEAQILSPWLQSQLLTSTAIALQSQQNEKASEYLAKAKQVLESAEQLAPMEVPSIMEIYNKSAPRFEPKGVQAAISSALLAIADQQAATDHLTKMVAAFSATAISGADAKQLDEQASSQRSSISSTLKTRLDLSNNDTTLRAYRQYARNVNAYVDASEDRSRWEQRVYRKLLQAEMSQQLAEALATTTGPLTVLDGSLGQFLIDELRRNKLNDLGATMDARTKADAGAKQTEAWHLWGVIRGMVEAKQYDQAIRILKSKELSEDAVDWVTLRALGTILSSKGDAKSWAFSAIHPLAREQALRLVAREAVTEKSHPLMLEKISLESLSSPEKAAAYYGLIEGISQQQ